LFNLIRFIQSSKTDKGQITAHKEYLNKSKADDKIKQLNQLFTLLETRLNLVVATLLNGLFLFDNLTVYGLNKWKKENEGHIQEWLRIVGEFDALVSLSTLAFNQHENTSLPSIQTENDYQFSVSNLQHPLIPKSKRVGNEFSIESNNDLFLITGSNMAGKSTFLRSVGINMILAQTGGVVFADRMNYKPMNLFTSMRIFDSIQSGASTFFAEVDRIKSILDKAKAEPIFILLDEILKGTNSKDKYTGSKALIEQLSGLQTSGFIATHDLALGSLSDEYSNIHNRRFEVEINEGEFIFDYKLKKGVCQTMNATELMKKMGIIVS
jgi:DNA mismatch repair ATPase MutS